MKASAPGKLYLFGEHAVMYGAPSIVTAINKRMTADVEKRKDDKITFDCMGKHLELKADELNKDVEKEFRFVVSTVRNFFEKFNFKSGLNIKTGAEFDDQKSFGSSASVTASLLKALDALFDTKMGNRELFDLGFKAHCDVQKTGSGFDVAASIYGGTLFFEYGGKTIEPIKIDGIPLVYAKLPGKFDTPEMIRKVEQDAKEYPDLYKQYVNTVKTIVSNARHALETRNWKAFGRMMYVNQGLLESIGVNTESSLEACCIAREHKAFGAKMTGAGGDNIIIVADDENRQKIIKAIEQKYPNSVIDIQVNAPGVRIEH